MKTKNWIVIAMIAILAVVAGVLWYSELREDNVNDTYRALMLSGNYYEARALVEKASLDTGLDYSDLTAQIDSLIKEQEITIKVKEMILRVDTLRVLASEKSFCAALEYAEEHLSNLSDDFPKKKELGDLLTECKLGCLLEYHSAILKMEESNPFLLECIFLDFVERYGRVFDIQDFDLRATVLKIKILVESGISPSILSDIKARWRDLVKMNDRWEEILRWE